MASSYKDLGTNDRVVSTTNIAESVSYASGTTTAFERYSSFFRVLSSSSPQLNMFDVVVGRSPDTVVAIAASSSILTKEQIVYNQLGKILLGHDQNSNIVKFGLDANSNTTDNILHNAYFVNFSRSQFKDKIKKGTFSLVINASGSRNIKLADLSGSMTVPTVRECETGEYGLLYVTSSDGTTTNFTLNSTNITGGLVFYEAGIAVVSPYLFAGYVASVANPSSSANLSEISGNVYGILSSTPPVVSGSYNIAQLFASASNVNDIQYAMASRIITSTYQSETELNSTIYFCRAFNNEFNYSSNPTYLSSSQIIVKEGDPMAQPVSYITTVGLYDNANQLLAVAKLSEPIKKTPDTELIARVRLDF